jgi:proteic killer suppression protein
MRIEFEDADLRRLYEDPSFGAPQYGRDVIKSFRKKVAFLEDAASELDLRAYRALHYEKLVGDRAGQHSIRLNDQWRLILRVATEEAGHVLIIIEIVDYHR